MSFFETVKTFEPKIGHKFTYDEAIKFWNALEEPFKLQAIAHLKCGDNSNLVHKAENCKVESEHLKTMDQFKIKGLSFFNKTINSKPLFPEAEKKKFLSAIQSTNLYKLLKGKMVGGYYEKYMKYKAKYLALRAELEGGDCIVAGKSAAEILKCKTAEGNAERLKHVSEKVSELEKILNSKSALADLPQHYFEALDKLYAQSKDKKYADLAEKLYDMLLLKDRKGASDGKLFMPNLIKVHRITQKEIGHNVWKDK
jgi:hypothetical protein